MTKEFDAWVSKVERGASELSEPTTEESLILAIARTLHTEHPSNVKMIRAWVIKNNHFNNFTKNRYDIDELATAFADYNMLPDYDNY